MHSDTQGNIVAISDDRGTIINRRSYTPFGEIRHIAYKEGITNALNALSINNRGYTGHEHIDNTELIHMNGRVYDPTIGRFMSADPYIQAPTDTQSYNRYSYVRNNPVNLIDPSGYTFGGWFGQRAEKAYNDTKHWGQDHRQMVKQGAAIVAAVVTTALTGGGAAPAWAGFFGNTAAGVIASGALAGAASGAIMTGTLQGTLKGALWGGVTAGAAYGVAEGVGALTGVNAHGASFLNGVNKASIIKAVAHGLSRAAIQKARYGTMKGAFLSGFVTSGFSIGAGAGYKGALVMAIVGGTVSEIGGGKFANGAMGSAFQYLFNDMMYGMRDPLTGDGSGLLDPFYSAVKSGWNSLQSGATSAISAMVSGLQTANKFSTYMGGVMTVASADNAVAIPGAIFWDGTAALTEGALLIIGQQSPSVSLANSANGAVIDIISPPGKFGAAANAILKNQTQAQ